MIYKLIVTVILLVILRNKNRPTLPLRIFQIQNYNIQLNSENLGPKRRCDLQHKSGYKDGGVK